MPAFARARGQRDDAEFIALAESAGCAIATCLTSARNVPDPRTLIGRGKVEEVRQCVEELGARLVLVDHPLSPVQERNLTRELGVPVLDRTTLILDIFAQRARSHEGKMQVELAQLRHLATRLVRGWTHLERQRGGIGMRGPGETQLETDRRLLAVRIRNLQRRLGQVERQRSQSRRARERSAVPLVALVGYTNAGKTTLFNSLTAGGAAARDQLFATLDPTVRRLNHVPGREILLSDTVGFIRDLPHELVAAFRATLEETLSASLVLQVVDVADPERDEHHATVDEVLAQIGADALPRLQVHNKIDLIGGEAGIERDSNGLPRVVRLSAADGTGFELLLGAIVERLGQGRIRTTVTLPARRQRLRARLYALDAVSEEQVQADGASRLKLDLARRDALAIASRGGSDGSWVDEHLLKLS